MTSLRDLLDPPDAPARISARRTPPLNKPLDRAALLSLAAGILALMNGMLLGFGGADVAGNVVVATGFLLIGVAVAAGSGHMLRAKAAILLADLALVGVTVWVFGPPLLTEMAQGVQAGDLLGQIVGLTFWLAMLGTALAAGVLIWSRKRGGRTE